MKYPTEHELNIWLENDFIGLMSHGVRDFFLDGMSGYIEDECAKREVGRSIEYLPKAKCYCASTNQGIRSANHMSEDKYTAFYMALWKLFQ